MMLFSLFVPGFVELLGASDFEEDLVASLNQWRDAVITRKDKLENPDFWFNIIELFKELGVQSVRRSPGVSKPALLTSENYGSLEVLWYLVASNERK